MYVLNSSLFFLYKYSYVVILLKKIRFKNPTRMHVVGLLILDPERAVTNNRT